jgi:hypothetical protein
VTRVHADIQAATADKVFLVFPDSKETPETQDLLVPKGARDHPVPKALRAEKVPLACRDQWALPVHVEEWDHKAPRVQKEHPDQEVCLDPSVVPAQKGPMGSKVRLDLQDLKVYPDTEARADPWDLKVIRALAVQ